MARVVVWILGVVAAGVLAPGCAAPRGAMGAERSGDFALGVTVLRDQSRNDREGKDAPPDARYIVDASGVLHGSFGEGSRPGTHPGFTRRLDPDALDRIWALARAIERANPSGEGEPEPAWRPGEPVRGAGGREVVLVELAGRATRRVIALDIEDADADRLVGTLGALAWAQERSGAIGAAGDDR